jgi:hypothetical protein
VGEASLPSLPAPDQTGGQAGRLQAVGMRLTRGHGDRQYGINQRCNETVANRNLTKKTLLSLVLFWEVGIIGS